MVSEVSEAPQASLAWLVYLYTGRDRWRERVTNRCASGAVFDCQCAARRPRSATHGCIMGLQWRIESFTAIWLYPRIPVVTLSIRRSSGIRSRFHEPSFFLRSLTCTSCGHRLTEHISLATSFLWRRGHGWNLHVQIEQRVVLWILLSFGPNYRTSVSTDGLVTSKREEKKLQLLPKRSLSGVALYAL